MPTGRRGSPPPSLCLFVLPMAIGLVLVFVSSTWKVVACRSKCSCTEDRSCRVSQSCPSDTPCSCSSLADPSVTTCEAVERDCDGHESTLDLAIDVGINQIMFFYKLCKLVMIIYISGLLALLALCPLLLTPLLVFDFFTGTWR